MLDTFTHCDKIQEKRIQLEKAAALASRLIARRAHSFRVQPSFMYFRKMDIALARLKELNLYDECKDMKDAIGIAKTARKLDDKFYLPSEQNFHHFLCKFQSFTKLLVRIVMCARESHKLFIEIIHRSAFIETISLFMAVVAQIWSICIDMCKCAVQFYNKFYMFYAINYNRSSDLPNRLDYWLADDYKEYIDFALNQNVTNTDENYILFDGNDSNDVKVIEQKFEPKLLVQKRIFDNAKVAETEKTVETKQKATVKMFKTQDLLEKRSFKYNEKSKTLETHEKLKFNKTQQIPTNIKTFDLGEEISRGDPKQKVIEKPIQHINVDQLKTIKEIRMFLDVEDKLRSKKREQNTKGIKNVDWDKFKTTTNQILILSHQGLVLKKFKKSWQQFIRMRKQ